MSLIEAQYEIGGLTIGKNTVYLVLKSSAFSWPTNRAQRRNEVNQSGWIMDTPDLFSGKVIEFEMLIKDPNLLVAMRALSLACTADEGDPEALVTLDMYHPHDTGAKRVQGRVRNLSFPGFDQTTYSSSTKCMLAFESKLAYMTGTVQKTATVGLSPGSGGRSYPLTFNRTYGAVDAGGFVNASNVGTASTFPTIRIDGPVTQPRIISQTQDKVLDLDITLGASDYLIINTADGEVLLNGTASRYNSLTADSEFFTIKPGLNSIVFLADTYEADASLQLTYDDGYFV